MSKQAKVNKMNKPGLTTTRALAQNLMKRFKPTKKDDNLKCEYQHCVWSTQARTEATNIFREDSAYQYRSGHNKRRCQRQCPKVACSYTLYMLAMLHEHTI
eukprot:5842911-Amphidinium_carterae.1